MNTSTSEQSEITEKNRSIGKELYFVIWNSLLFFFELYRDGAHGDNKLLQFYNSGKIGGYQFGSVPLATEGLWGFIDQHIGDSLETLMLIYAWRIPVSLISRAVELYSDKKVDPRMKVGAAVLLGTISTSVAEFAFSNADPLDLFGCLVAGIYASVGFELIEYMFKPETFDSLKSKFQQLGAQHSSLQTDLNRRKALLREWLVELGVELNHSAMKVLAVAEQHGRDLSGAFSYLDMEARIFNLMLGELQHKIEQKIGSTVSDK